NLVHYGRCLLGIRSYDLIVASHVAAGDDLTILLKTARLLHRRRGKLIVFLGNEYDLLDEKIAFVRSTQADALCSQLRVAAAEYLYAGSGAGQLLSVPHALNPKIYHPRPDVERTLDIGFVGDMYWPFVGDDERARLIRFFEAHGAAKGLTCKISTQRITR